MPLLVIGTTVIDSEVWYFFNYWCRMKRKWTYKWTLFKTWLRCFLEYVLSFLHPVLFIENDLEIRWILLLISSISLWYYVTYSTNKYGTPIFREMMLYLEERYQSTFYGYCNGDLLFDSSIIQLLDYTNKQIQNHLLFNKVTMLISY